MKLQWEEPRCTVWSVTPYQFEQRQFDPELPAANSVGRRTLIIKLINRVGEATLTISPSNGDMIDTSGADIVWAGATPPMKTMDTIQ